ncbi:DUF58 domain-containing protein [Gimesia aquarii]|uniref:DUF58 domain-containing protein n=1 Tax=Gimesia aquarii TaxID=2527964 RepID=A0A517VPM9_9PLAN|nr:DUF58 domain-containing protein [Gimesia aquarii]QDT94972.1 hypothetical protein V144x_04060 [Gimesia aquarii]
MSSKSSTPRTQRSKKMNRKYLRVQDLRRFSHLTFSPRKIIEGQYSGQHATPQRGQSVEFRDYRQYIPGDDVGSIDWKVFGRSDKLFIKMYEHQSDLRVNLLVDASASMAYHGVTAPQQIIPSRRSKSASSVTSKYDYACSLAGAIAFLLIKQHDRVSITFAREGLKKFMRANNSMQHLSEILTLMESTRPHGTGNLPDAIRDLVGKVGRRDLLIVFSDLLDDRNEIMKALSMCLHRGGEVILFHVLHADELRLPDVEHGVFIDSESGAKLRLNVSDIRSAYQKEMKEFLDGWSKMVKSNAIDYSLCSTSDPYWKSLERYLTGRAARV